ncbi:MAG: hypothetical protein U0K19_03380, partial [Bifidobacteriaceae bacterium]|nr:hypothetical protein [Bifidobacteriaceae bacterium]
MSRSSAMTTTEDTSTKSVDRASTISRLVGTICSLARSLTAILNIVATSSYPTGQPLLQPRQTHTSPAASPIYTTDHQPATVLANPQPPADLPSRLYDK